MAQIKLEFLIFLNSQILPVSFSTIVPINSELEIEHSTVLVVSDPIEIINSSPSVEIRGFSSHSTPDDKMDLSRVCLSLV